jgi:phage terminase small subunit|tara:strand:- start:4731 stop:5318 length:588 start_codon:yes stop_codon:yes gene_type:complete
MGLPKRLTEMQKRFAEFIVFGGPDGPVSKTEAAILAGYSPNRAPQEGSELTNPRQCPLVVEYVGKLHEERLQKHEVTYSRHVAELDRIKRAALKKSSFSSAVNAEVARGKAAGLYIDRKIIKTGKLEDMSEEELENKMKQILDDYAPLLNAKIVEGEAIESPKSSESSEPTDEESSSDPQKKKNHRLPDQTKQKV